MGGAAASSDQPGHLAVDARPVGSYYALDTNKNGSPWVPFSVAGTDTGASLPTGATLKAIDSATWSKSPSRFRARGWLRFKNRADKNHFISMARLRPGKTLADFVDSLQSRSGPNPVDFRFGINSGVMSPGHDMALKYRLPRGDYVLTCYWPDASMGGMPHVFMGMYRVVKVR